MLASIEHGFVLFCNPKSASTSLEAAYRKHANFDVGRGSRWKHLSWREYREAFGDYFDRHDCETYAVVRDPVDLLISWWRFRQRPKIQNPSHPHHDNSTVGVSFRDWVDEWASDDPPPRAVIIEQSDVLMGHDGHPAPIRYFRYEDVQELARCLNQRIGVEYELTRSNSSPRIDVDVDTDWLLSMPRIQKQIRFYEAALSA
jgi:hypothetical protein